MEGLNKQTSTLAKDLSGFDMALTTDEFNRVFENSTPYRIANIPDFNQLIVISEFEKIPVIAIDDAVLRKHSIATPTYRRKVDDFVNQYISIVNGILKL